jgi:hypothetical protein
MSFFEKTNRNIANSSNPDDRRIKCEEFYSINNGMIIHKWGSAYFNCISMCDKHHNKTGKNEKNMVRRII